MKKQLKILALSVICLSCVMLFGCFGKNSNNNENYFAVHDLTINDSFYTLEVLSNDKMT